MSEKSEEDVKEDIAALQDLYDYRVYDLRNTTLDEVFSNQHEETSFDKISIHKNSFE